MPPKTVALDHEACEVLRRRRRVGETFSDAGKRLSGARRSIVEYFDTTRLIDYVGEEDRVGGKVAELLSSGGRRATPSAAVAEPLVGAHYWGGRELSRTLEFLERSEVLPFVIREATEAGRSGAEALRQGTPISDIDLVVAPTARYHRGFLVTRDSVFSQVAGLAVEAY